MIALLLAPNINFFTEALVGRLKVVKFDEGLVELVLKKFDFVLVLAHLGGGGASTELVLALNKLVVGLLELVFKNH